jgi:hypothetical protein
MTRTPRKRPKRYARFYKAWAFHCDHGRQISWHRTKREALRAVKDAKADEGHCGPEGVDEYTVELDTAALIHWLNVHFDTENG